MAHSTTDTPKPSSSSSKTEGNVVVVDDNTPGLSSEDQLFLFWQKNKTLIVGSLILIAGALLTYQVLLWIQRSNVASMQAAYQEAIGNDAALVSFAQDYQGEPLSGFAYLTLADKEFEAEQFTQAASHYQQASQSLAIPLVKGRALLGYAIASVEAGDQDKGINILSEIKDDASITTNLRMQGAYKLILLLKAQDDASKAKEVFDNLDPALNDTIWYSQAQRLVE